MKTTVLCGLGLLLTAPALAQTASADTSHLGAVASLSQHYAAALRDVSALYSGPEYLNYTRPGTQGHRFFGVKEAQAATIVYGQETYTGVPLRYDLVRGQLVLKAQGGTRELRLVNERVARFTLGGHTFVRLAGDSATGLPVPGGFYEVLVDGPVRLLAAHRKKYEEWTASSRIESDITASDEYFIQKDGHNYPVSKEGDVLRVFAPQRAALRGYAQGQNLTFDEAGRAAALVALVRYQATLGAK